MMKPNYLVLILLALLFAAPGGMAYLYYQNPQWLAEATTNKGELLNPPLLFARELDGEKKWRLILWYPKACDRACLHDLDQLARIRLALGRRLYEVQQWLIQPEEKPKQLMSLTRQLREQDIKVSAITEDTLKKYPLLSEQSKIVIADPEGYLVMSYATDAKPKDIYHDIKQLLNTTEK